MIKPFHLDITSDDRAILHRGLDTILDSGSLILGQQTLSFEREFASFVGTSCAVSFNSCTSALEVQLRLENVVGRKVAVPTNTNFATVASIVHAGGIPVFLDMDIRTFAPSLTQLKEAHRAEPDIAGVMWVHIGGVITPEFTKVSTYCAENELFLLEDCAHAHGSRLDGKHAGTFGRSGAFSFFPTKVMTTMEGGMIVLNDETQDALMRSMRNQGKRDGTYNVLHVDLGSSWRLSEFAAVWGLVQLKKLDQMLDRRQEIAEIYSNAFDAMGIQYVSTRHMERASNYKVISLAPDGTDIVALKHALSSAGVVLGGSVYDVPCHRQPVFEKLKHSTLELPVAEKYCGRQFCLPITSGMTKSDAEYVVDVLRTFFNLGS